MGKIAYVARWVFAFPAAFLISWASFIFVSVANRLLSWLSGDWLASLNDFLFVELAPNFAMGAMFVFAAAKIAPTFHFGVAVSAATIVTLLVGYMGYFPIATGNYLHLAGVAAAILGGWFVVYSGHTGAINLRTDNASEILDSLS